MTPTEAIATGYATHGLICSQKSSEIELADVYNVLQLIHYSKKLAKRMSRRDEKKNKNIDPNRGEIGRAHV